MWHEPYQSKNPTASPLLRKAVEFYWFLLGCEAGLTLHGAQGHALDDELGQ